MANKSTSEIVTRITPEDTTTNQRILASDDCDTVPVDTYLAMADIYDIADTQAAAALAAIAPIVSSSGAVVAGNFPMWIDANTIEDSAVAVDDLLTFVTGDATVTPGNIAVFGADGYNIEDGGAPVTVAGADTQVQFNDGGAFAGDADLTWDKTNNILTVNGVVRSKRGGRIITSSGSELTTDDLVVGNTASNITITMLAATGTFRARSFQNKSTGIFYVAAAGGETINGAANKILNQWDSVTIVDVAAGEWVIAT